MKRSRFYPLGEAMAQGLVEGMATEKRGPGAPLAPKMPYSYITPCDEHLSEDIAVWIPPKYKGALVFINFHDAPPTSMVGKFYRCRCGQQGTWMVSNKIEGVWND